MTTTNGNPGKNVSDVVVRKEQSFKTFLSGEKVVAALAEIVPKHLTAEKIVKMALMAASRQPKLYECSSESLLGAVMTSGKLGLDCSGILGQGYLVPYWNGKTKQLECQFIPGYQGLIELARRGGNISRIESRAVYEKDTFSVEYGLDPVLKHVPYLSCDRGNIICVYAFAEITEGNRQVEVMTIEEVFGIRERSKSRTQKGDIIGPWATDFSEMARKTVVRRLTKWLPMSLEMAEALEADNQQYGDSLRDTADEIKTGVEQLRNKLTKETAKPVDSKEVERPTEPTEPVEPVDPELAAKKEQQIKAVRAADAIDNKDESLLSPEPSENKDEKKKTKKTTKADTPKDVEHRKRFTDLLMEISSSCLCIEVDQEGNYTLVEDEFADSNMIIASKRSCVAITSFVGKDGFVEGVDDTKLLNGKRLNIALANATSLWDRHKEQT